MKAVGALPIVIFNWKAGAFFLLFKNLYLWELDHKEGWVPKNRHFQIVVPEKILKSPLDCKEI